MNNQCQCESKTAEICCPSDEILRKEWLLNLEKDHKPVRHISKEIVKKLKLSIFFEIPYRVLLTVCSYKVLELTNGW